MCAEAEIDGWQEIPLSKEMEEIINRENGIYEFLMSNSGYVEEMHQIDRYFVNKSIDLTKERLVKLRELREKYLSA